MSTSLLLNPDHMLFATVPSVIIVLFAVSLLLSSLGFARTVYFISTGYGLSVAGVAFFSFVFYRTTGNLAALQHMALILVYGFRLATYLTVRERKASFRTERAETDRTYAVTSPFARFGIWIGVSLLYVAMASPVLFHFSALNAESHGTAALVDAVRGGASGAAFVVTAGLLVGYCGLAIEWISDRQKARLKRREPSAFCRSGLYRLVRYPNYFGEIVVWLGSYLAGIPFYTSWVAWILSTIGLLTIVLIMLGSAKRLEQKQSGRYGAEPEYQEYIRKVPILIPLVPLYSLAKLRVYLG